MAELTRAAEGGLLEIHEHDPAVGAHRVVGARIPPAPGSPTPGPGPPGGLPTPGAGPAGGPPGPSRNGVPSRPKRVPASPREPPVTCLTTGGERRTSPSHTRERGLLGSRWIT